MSLFTDFIRTFKKRKRKKYGKILNILICKFLYDPLLHNSLNLPLQKYRVYQRVKTTRT